MATYSSRTMTSTRHEWIIPAAQPWGAAAAEVAKAWEAASAACGAAQGIPPGGTLPDNALSFHVGDDEIIISFVTEEQK